MLYYIYLLIAAILLAVSFGFQKLYQQKKGADLKAGLVFNIYTGIFTAVVFLFICKFQINLTLYAVIMASAMSIFLLLYTLLGFKVINEGNVSLYTMFLMSGGMIVPYVWGIVFLNEKIVPLRIIGLAVMIFAILLPHFDIKNSNLKQLALCLVIFFLNGGCSVVSKLGQTENRFGVIDAGQFVLLTGLTRFIFCSLALLFLRKKANKKTEEDSSRDKKSIYFILIVTVISAIIGGVSYLLQLIGAANLPATVVYPIISGGSIIFTTIAGALVFKEKIDLKQKIGVLLCFAGTFMFL